MYWKSIPLISDSICEYKNSPSSSSLRTSSLGRVLLIIWEFISTHSGVDKSKKLLKRQFKAKSEDFCIFYVIWLPILFFSKASNLSLLRSKKYYSQSRYRWDCCWVTACVHFSYELYSFSLIRVSILSEAPLQFMLKVKIWLFNEFFLLYSCEGSCSTSWESEVFTFLWTLSKEGSSLLSDKSFPFLKSIALFLFCWEFYEFLGLYLC